MLSLLTNGIIAISSGDLSFHPTAKEIFSVAFEDCTDLRGIQVSIEDLRQSGLAFSPHVVDVGLLFEPADATAIRCNIRAFHDTNSFPLIWEGDRFLDYTVSNGKWLPLAPGSLDAVLSFCQSRGFTASHFADSQAGCPVNLAFYLRAMRENTGGFRVEDRIRDKFEAIRISEALQGNMPSGVKATLYPYQLNGYRWLSFMRSAGLGTLLADEMGLGKTLQVICLLQEAKSAGCGRNLIIAPASLLENWRRELAKFSPQLRSLVHAGGKRTGFPDQLRPYDVVISSYETVVGDLSMLMQLDWDIVVVDEAQNIKNPLAKRTVQIKKLPHKCGIAVTGTPVENSLTDLWSVMDFAVPGLFGSLDTFTREYPDTPDSADSVERLVAPLILRRRVEDVAKDLPERIDIPQPLVLDECSAERYEELRQTSNQQGGGGLQQIMKLRQFCVHPWLADSLTDSKDAAACSIKLRRLIELVEEIAGQNRKVIVFTSFQAGFDLIKNEISARLGLYVNGIDGRVLVPDRQKVVDEFSSLTGPGVLVLNPKAAGTGLNITAANYVIHYNLEWNPAVEDQATARAYRRGQTQRVFVYRLFFRDTVEEVMDDRMAWKRTLASAAVSTTDESRDVADVMRALTISPVGRTGKT